MSRFLTSYLNWLSPYIPGEQPQDKKYIKLNTNESPYPPTPAIKAAMNSGEIDDLRLYSDPDLKSLVTSIANLYGVDQSCVFCGNGSDEVLAMAFMSWGGNKGVVYPDISYGFYSVYAKVFNIADEVVKLDSKFRLNVRDLKLDGKMFVFANPNAPTGMAVDVSDIEHLAKNNRDSVIVVDEAYVDFGGDTALPLLKTYDNVIVVRTFSKSRQLAGARLGYAIGSKQLIEDLNRVKFSINPYNVNRMTCIAGKCAIEDVEWFADCVSKVINTRERLKNALLEMGFSVLNSKTNFLFAKHPVMSGKELYLNLKNEGILVRHFDKDRINDYIRITIGTDSDIDTVIEKLKSILGV